MALADSKSNNLAVLGVVIALGFIITGALISGAIRHFKDADRFVTVKGLAEEEVKSDQAVWNLNLIVTGDDLAVLNRQIDDQAVKVEEFLKKQGFSEADLARANYSVADTFTREYQRNTDSTTRYIVKSSIVLRTGKVDEAEKASRAVGSLVENGIVLEDNQGPSFFFNNLNEIKPKLIAKATKSARESAEQFAEDSGSTVGKIRTANQGIVTIRDRDYTQSNNYGGETYSADKSIYKNIRVVATVDYFLD
jgi:hypothetical protein